MKVTTYYHRMFSLKSLLISRRYHNDKRDDNDVEILYKAQMLAHALSIKIECSTVFSVFFMPRKFYFFVFFFSRSNGSKFDYFGYVFRTKKTSMTSCQIHNISHTWNTNDANSQVTAFWNVSSWEKHHKMGPFLLNGRRCYRFPILDIYCLGNCWQH